MPCIYCKGERGDLELTLEHVWPQALGGAAAPQLFKSNSVCRTCNNSAGLWIDGAFLKNWFISHERANADRLFLDPRVPGVMPLQFAGLDQRFPTQVGEVAEAWWGPAGDQVTFVHPMDEERWHGYAGGDILRRRRRATAGRAYILLGSDQPYWFSTSLKSFVAFMPQARLFCATYIPGLHGPVIDKLTPESQANAVELAELAWVRSEDATLHHVQIPHNFNFSHRFLAKVALGIGCGLFPEDYFVSEYAGELRKAMWGQSDSRARGTALLNDSALNGSRLSGLNGVWSIMLRANPGTFAVMIRTPSGQSMTMLISDEDRFWSNPSFGKYQMGEFYFVVPARNVFAGPVPLGDFINHQNGHSVNPIIAEIEGMKSDPNQLPPRKAPNPQTEQG